MCMDGGGTHVWHAVVRVFVNIKGSAISVRNVKEVVSAHIKEFGHSAKIAEADPFANTTVFALCVLNAAVDQFVSTNAFVASVIFARSWLLGQKMELHENNGPHLLMQKERLPRVEKHMQLRLRPRRPHVRKVRELVLRQLLGVSVLMRQNHARRTHLLPQRKNLS